MMMRVVSLHVHTARVSSNGICNHKCKISLMELDQPTRCHSWTLWNHVSNNMSDSAAEPAALNIGSSTWVSSSQQRACSSWHLFLCLLRMLLPGFWVSWALCCTSAASYHCSRYQCDDCTILASLVGCSSLGWFQLWAAFCFSFGLYPMDNPMTTNTAPFQPTPFDRKRQPSVQVLKWDTEPWATTPYAVTATKPANMGFEIPFPYSWIRHVACQTSLR